jgi:hypothetical protein
MSKPFYQVNQPIKLENKRHYRFINSIIIVIIVTTVAVVSYLLLNINHINNPTVKSARGVTLTQRIGGSKTFTSKYFEFSDTNDWLYAPNDSTPSMITYLQYHDGVVARSITVYVNQTPLQLNLATTRVLPVNILNDNSFSTTDISQTCGSLYGSAPKVDKPVSMNGTNFVCVPDSPEYLVIAGQINGSYNLRLKRANGQLANYIIIYHDLSTDPNPQPFLDVMQTFKAL